jgi:tRNA-specific 2-thiouridylase
MNASGEPIVWPVKGKGPRVAVAISGGVDSSVAMALLAERGHDVVGVMARLWSEPPQEEMRAPATSDSEAFARRACEHLGVPFYAVDLAEEFRDSVVDPFIAEYLRGRTPNPCLNCNRDVKFGLLLEYALKQGADFLTTGHYARIQKREEDFRLLRGLDARKDQSYMLHMLGQRELSHILFPLGEMTKSEVRAASRARGLPTAERPESQEICFIRDNNYHRFLKRFAPNSIASGPIYDAAGQRVGTHKGLPFYTIGQREGLGIAHSEPLYVLEIRPAENTLIVGTASELGRDCLTASGVSFVAGSPPPIPAQVTAKIRYRAREEQAILTSLEDDRASVQFAAPLRDITAGQGVVFYDGDIVLGGGVID